MRDLFLLRQLSADLFKKGEGRSSGLSYQGDALDKVAVDPFLGTVYVLTEAKKLLALNPMLNELTMEQDLSEVIPAEGFVVGCLFVPDLNAVCIAIAAGDLIVFDVEQQTAECVGFVDSEIRCMSWSPDYEVMVLVTGNNTLVAMTQEWDILVEVPIEEEDKPEAEGEAKAEASELEASSLPVISWRGDGQYFVLNCQDSDGVRRLRVWTRALVLDSVSEATPKLENLVSWRPSGSSIASSQQKPNKHDIVFFERNGLRLDRMDFTLRDDAEVISMNWNEASELLALALKLKSSSEDKRSSGTVLQLWHMNNYHWYLKQEILYHDWELAHCFWDPENAMLLNVVCRNGLFFQYRFCWDVHCSLGNHAANQSIVAVTDGHTLKLTPFNKMVVPPPMHATSLELAANIRDVSFAPNSYEMAILLTTSTLFFCRSTANLVPPFEHPPEIVAFLSLRSSINKAEQDKEREGEQEDTKLTTSYRHLTYLRKDVVLVVENTIDKRQERLMELKFSIPEGDEVNGACKEVTVVNARFTDVEDSVLRIFHNKDTDSVFVELADGSVLRYSHSADAAKEENVLQPHVQFHLSDKVPTTCPWLSSAIVAGKEAVIGLSERSKLYIDQQLVSSECNSFAMHSKYLLYTTLGHRLCFLRLSLPFSESSVPSSSVGATHQYDDTRREVERGSRLVCVVPLGIRVILQMPRGNLEEVNPRLLLLAIITQLLDNQEWQAAFVLMRKHRIDLNLMYDHNPAVFLAHAEDFIQQIQRISFLNLFVSCLREEDTTKTLFRSEYQQRGQERLLSLDEGRSKLEHSEGADSSSRPITENQSKVNLVCDTLREAFNKLDSKRYLLPIVTTYVRKQPSQLEEALLLIRKLRDEQPVQVLDPFGEQEKVQRSGPTAESALKYLICLVNVNQLYDVALGTYDFELTIMVAQQSQKDPKEYVPFLERLKQLNIYEQRYEIDKHLGRHLSSLRNLSQAGEQHFATCLEVVQQHSLYKEALQIFSSKDHSKSKLDKVKEIYANYLLKNDQANQAGLLFSQIGELEKAANAFKTAANWRLLFATCVSLNYSQEETQSLAYEVAELLTNLARYAEAAAVLERYAEDPEESLVTLLLGRHFQEALRLAHFHSRTDLIPTHVQPSVQETYKFFVRKVTKRQQKFVRYADRLVVVRQQKLRLREELEQNMGGGGGGGVRSEYGDFGDNLFETSSEVSHTSTQQSDRSSAYTSTYASTVVSEGGTKRRSGRQRRKKVTGREGGPHEEEWLVTTLSNLIPSEKFQEEVHETLQMLVYFGQLEEGQELQGLLSSFIDSVRSRQQLLSESQCLFLEEQRLQQRRLAAVALAKAAAGAEEKQKEKEEEGNQEQALTNYQPAKQLKELDWKLSILS
ncbi:Elongator complex protein 1 [Balamuthia mandrillaris]